MDADPVSSSCLSIRGCSVCRPSPAYADQFYCDPIGLNLRPARIHILAQIGGKTFELDVPPAFAPYAVYKREKLADGGSLWDLTKSVVNSCGGYFAAFNHNHRTLKDYLTRWHTRVLLSNKRLAIDEITRTEETRGIKCDDTDLLWYDWRTVEVLEKETDSHFQVQLDGHRYGCYAPNDFSKPPDYVSFLQEVRVWKKVTDSPARPGAIPRFFGLVCTPEKPGMVLAALYESIEAGGQTLDQVDIRIVSLTQRERWFWQIRHAISFLHENGASWTRSECTRPTTRVAIGTNGNAFLKYIHFGELQSNRFVPNCNLDWKALAKVQRFLRLGPKPARARVARQRPFEFMHLPFDVRYMIYELLLVYPGHITWNGKYRHRMDTPSSPSEKLAAGGLFYASREVRYESLSYLLEHNTMQIEAPHLSEFLSLPLEPPNEPPRKFGLSVRRIVFTLTVTTKSDPETWQKQCEGVLELKKYCSSLKYVRMIPFHQKLWSHEDSPAGNPLTSLPFRILTEESEYDYFIYNFSKHRTELAEG
ncbi:uncharacterized protein LTHEOB_12882 [Lasiodiplodia theobromae]|uniref:uncharacterized protein n=1 Tax=Lasiodiplodia theobromae TaxID=45133 RepID=UPI0015C3800A|nr:uncharacterized protein LTHEOB_12882 [Lasiodiplodia theobromae]KAF4534694.1 hypothetical protein LTHEOB_12882 [Lasiodiplodia theobromae]